LYILLILIVDFIRITICHFIHLCT